MNKNKSIVDTYESLRSERRQSLDWRWGEAYRYTMPERGIPYINQTFGAPNTQSDLEQARRLQGSIYDTTLLDGAQTLARSLYQGATPPHSMWFDLRLPGVTLEQLSEAEKRRFDTDARLLHNLIHGSNYNSAAMEFFLDYVIGGMVGVFIDLNDDNEFYFEYIPMWNIMVQEKMKKGRIDTAYRLLSLKLPEIISMWGKDALTPEQKEKYADAQAAGRECTEKFDYIHCVRPAIGPDGKQRRFNPDPLKRIGNNKRWESLYVCKSSGKVVDEGGYDEFPFIIPRWRCIPETPYALGPVSDALPDAKSLNKLTQQMFRANEVAINPPMKVKNDGIINPRTTQIGPRKLIKMQDVRNMEPLFTGTRYDIAMSETARMQTNIRKLLLSQELDPINKANPTAYETDRYYEIMRQRLGPAYNVLHDQLIQPLIQRCYAIAYRAGLLGGRAPERIGDAIDAGVLPVAEFKSPLARAGRIEDIQAIDRVVATMAAQREIFPNVLDNLDSDAAIRFVSDAIGAPTAIMRTKAQVTKLRKDKQELMQEQRALEAQQAGQSKS